MGGPSRPGGPALRPSVAKKLTLVGRPFDLRSKKKKLALIGRPFDLWSKQTDMVAWPAAIVPGYPRSLGKVPGHFRLPPAGSGCPRSAAVVTGRLRLQMRSNDNLHPPKKTGHPEEPCLAKFADRNLNIHLRDFKTLEKHFSVHLVHFWRNRKFSKISIF